MQELISQSVELLREMVRVPSISTNEDAVCKMVADWIVSKGIAVEIIGKNIVARNLHFDGSKPTLALSAHLDTVAPVDGYTNDPYEPGDSFEIVYGLGSNDDGGSVVSMIATFRYYYEQQLPINLMLVLTCEEECSGPNGAQMLYGDDSPLNPNRPKWIIFGEPTCMNAAVCERGLLVLDGQATGVSGHAAREEGINALYIAIDDIQKIRNHSFDKISPTMGKVHVNVTQINAGTAHNVIPDCCKFVVDVRPTEQYSNDELYADLQSICKSKLTPRNLLHQASATKVDSPLLKAVDALGIEKYSSPTTSDWMCTKIDGIKIGPGESSRSHKANEFIKVSEISEAVDVYIKLVEKIEYGNIVE